MQAQDTAYERRWWTLGVLSLALLIIGLDNTILNVALPTLAEDLDAGSSALQWIVDSYMLVFAGLLLTAGSLGDRFGRRKALVAGLVIFLVGSVGAALSTSAGMLIAFRALMGVGGAFIMPSTLSVLTNVFPANERAKAIGIWAAVSGLGIAIGPVAGGFLLEHFDWGSVFLINVPFVVGALLLCKPLVPESRDPEARRLDLVGAGLSIAGLTTLLWGIIEAPVRGWEDSLVVGSFALAVALLGAFAAWELGSRTPMLDIRLFKDRRFSAAGGSIAMVFFALFGTIFFLTSFLQSVMGYEPLKAGAALIPVSVGMILAAPQAPKLTARFGTRIVVGSGLGTVAGALFLLSTATVDTGYGLIALVLVQLGWGIGTAMTPATDAVMSSLPKEHAGVGSALNDTVRQVGGAMGVAILGSLMNSSYRPDMDAVVAELPAEAAETAQDSVGGAVAVADKIGGEQGSALADTAQLAFTNAMSSAVTIAAVVAMLGAAIAFAFLPGRKEDARAKREAIEAEEAAMAEAVLA